MARAGGVQEIAGEQRVDVESVERHAVAPEDQRGLLQVVSHLGQAGVRQRPRQGAERRIAPEGGVRRRVCGVRAARSGRGPAPADTRDAHQVGAHRVPRVRQHREAHPPGAA